MKLSKQILLAFAVVIILSVIDTYTNYLLSLKVRKNTESLAKSESITRNSNNLHKSIIEMQSGFRGFLLSYDTTFLDYYNKGITDIPLLYTDLKYLTKENKQQQLILDTINKLHSEWIVYADALIASKKKSLRDNSSSRDYNYLFEKKLKRQVGKKLNDEIANKFVDFDRGEYKLRKALSKMLIASIERTHTISFIFLSLTILIGVLSTVYIIRILSKRIASMVRLAENISKGKFSVVNDPHRDELTGLSTSLNIMSEKLSKNIQELENRNVELNQFAYVVSHDLKAPLRGIHNVIQWIGEDLGNQLSLELKKYIGIITERTRRMEDLIDGLLDYAKLREKNQPEKINVQQMVEDIMETIVPRHFKVEVENLPLLMGERIKLEQVFTNIISNAVKYSPSPDEYISITCKELPEFYQFSIKDNGIGIDPEYQEKIFEIFQTLREKHEKESTGIGLAITKKIIDDQHGTIKVNSKLGKGAEFVFTWPRNKKI